MLSLYATVNALLLFVSDRKARHPRRTLLSISELRGEKCPIWGDLSEVSVESRRSKNHPPPGVSDCTARATRIRRFGEHLILGTVLSRYRVNNKWEASDKTR